MDRARRVYAVCHVRGGGEKGRAWHVDGMLERKMNCIHDFEACGQALIDAWLSSPAHLFAQGGSMGGVLIGRLITDRPELFAAAHIAVGIVNPLRLRAAKNGPTQIPEVGDPDTETGFRTLLALDPYQHVAAAAYPATIFTVGLNDARVSPWMTGKMAARMQALGTGSKPVAIRLDADAGHGPGSTRDQAFTERADVWSSSWRSRGIQTSRRADPRRGSATRGRANPPTHRSRWAPALESRRGRHAIHSLAVSPRRSF